MGIIKLIKTSLDKRRIKKAFEPYLNKNALKMLLAGKLDPLNRLEEQEIDFILVKIKNDKNHDIAVNVGKIIDIAGNYGTIDILSGIVAIYLNWPEKEGGYTINRTELSAELTSFLGDNIAILHGRRKCLCGMYGSFNRFHHGVIIPGILHLLSQLESCEYGNITGIDKNTGFMDKKECR